MLRVPVELSEPASLELRAVMQADEKKPCGLYMKAVIMDGMWFGGAIVQVRPLKLNRAGSIGAGNRTEWPFSMQVSPEGPWKSLAEFEAEGGSEALTDMVKVTVEEREEFGKHLEGQAFSVHIGKTGKPASIVVSQAQHEALNMELVNMQALQQRTLGGLLGTEKHSKGVEELTEGCKEDKALRTKEKALDLIGSRESWDVSRLSASWA